MVGRVRVGAEGRHRAVQRAWAQSVCSNPRAGPKELGRELGETPLLSREFGYDFKRERFLTAREKEALADQPWDAYNVPDPIPDPSAEGKGQAGAAAGAGDGGAAGDPAAPCGPDEVTLSSD